MVKLARLLFPALSLRLVRNAYAGETSCSALQLGFCLHQSISRSIVLLFQTRQLLMAGISLNDPIELIGITMIRECNFQLLPA